MVADRDELGSGKVSGKEVRKIDEANGAAIRTSTGKLSPADLAISARNVVDDERPADYLFCFRGKKPGAGVRTGTGLVGDYHIDFAGRSPGGK